MRIISDFKDYYDFPQKYGTDPNIQYLRKPRIFNFGRHKKGWTESIKPTMKQRPYFNLSGKNFDDPNWYTIGFCGKIYELAYYVHKDQVHIFRTKDAALEWAAGFLNVDLKKRKKKYRSYWSWNWFGGNDDKPFWATPVDQMNERTNDRRDRYRDMFKAAPLFIEKSRSEIEINFCFRSYGLESFMEANTLYQELYQYMSNVWAIDQKEIPVPSDKDMVFIKGFDKHSFRKDKQK